ncbi:hypothetical protein P154DRAFT_576088 [Amniculicola lignicola CBS 123094]|uniref:Uncharacterized protein n=1 Tax=Amniculicola lignicola CBS 123094 TaxID=1392246 RepID=A0A6A5WH70_9PLEO|nr:hypothetical protein P154DRAFT_576088 [Amniculicola lignicola CBS 123094]
MDALKNLAGKFGGSSKSSSTPASGDKKAEGQDYADKGLSALQKKFGFKSNAATNEKITDAARGQYEKSTGKKVPEKFSN